MSIDGPTKKRRRENGLMKPLKKSKTEIGITDGATSLQQQLTNFESAISEGRQISENVSALLSLVKQEKPDQKGNPLVLISLCKAFTRLIASGDLASTRTAKATHAEGTQLHQLYTRYLAQLQTFVSNGGESIQSTSLQLFMRLLKVQAEYSREDVWSSNVFSDLLKTLFQAETGSNIRRVLIEEYMMVYDDCAYHILDFLSKYASQKLPSQVDDNIMDVLAGFNKIPASTDELSTFFMETSTKPTKKGKPLVTPSSLRRVASSAWLALISSPSLTDSHRKRILGLISPSILPWLIRPETLFDFLTSSFDQGGSLSLLSLAGIYNLITTKNLDYPSFYPKLYSLLTPSLMHSKHRSRFFRHLNIFLSSTHLPVTLVASFIKRMSRLALYAPPAAIVAIVPYIYNLLKDHPQTTFMIHRAHLEGAEYNDPFNPLDSNPQTTGAISSSLWELHTLALPPSVSTSPLGTSSQSLGHYHPNVSSLAQIICLQFTKQQYNTEDFLDHSYASMLDAELKRGVVKKEPVIEWQIPKRIFVREADDEGKEGLDLVRQLWTFD